MCVLTVLPVCSALCDPDDVSRQVVDALGVGEAQSLQLMPLVICRHKKLDIIVSL